jgi:hypothetical protein
MGLMFREQATAHCKACVVQQVVRLVFVRDFCLERCGILAHVVRIVAGFQWLSFRSDSSMFWRPRCRVRDNPDTFGGHCR